MKVTSPKYEIGDCLLVEGSELKIERVLTVVAIRIDLDVYAGKPRQEIYYQFKESKFCHEESLIVRKIKP